MPITDNTAKWNVKKVGAGTPAEMIGATSSAKGKPGVVPEPAAGDQAKFLRGDGTWQNVPTPSLSGLGVTATATELNIMDGVTATTAELNYVDGVTSNIQTQLNGKLSTTGTAAKATADASGNTITSTYETKANAITGLSVSGRVITYTKGNGSTGTITTQDTAGGYHAGNATSIGGASATNPAVVVASYKSGTSWYRKYSDGWIEQGGRLVRSGSGSDITVTFATAFSDTNYTLTTGHWWQPSGYYNLFVPNYSSISKTGFKITSAAEENRAFDWYACGI